MISAPSGNTRRPDSSVSASSQYVPGRFRAPSCPVSPVSNFSRPSSAAPPMPQLPQISEQPPSMPPPQKLDSTINLDSGYSSATENHEDTAAPRPAYIKKTYSQYGSIPRRPISGRESLDIVDVSTGIPRRHRTVDVKSMAVSTHDAASLCSARISHVQPQSDEDEWWALEPSEMRPSLMPAPLARAVPKKVQQSYRPQFHKPTYATGSLDRGYAFPPKARSHRSSEAVHPSSRVLLSHPSPDVRRLMTSRRHLLSALESATLPQLDSSAPAIPWWQDWPTAKSLAPLPTRTLANLRTCNTRYPATDPKSSTTPTAPSGGQGTHFARLTPFRFCLHTRAHGPTTDFSHPSYFGSVAAGRTLWQKMYRDEHYRCLTTSRFSAYGVAQAKPRKQTPLPGYWLRRATATGGTRQLVKERDAVKEGAALAGASPYIAGALEQDGEEAVAFHGAHRRGLSKSSTQTFKSSMKSVKRRGSMLKYKWESMKRDAKDRKEEKEGRKRYTPVPPEMDHSGWYSDDSDA